MGKISPVSAKYIIHTHIQIDGTVDRPDIIGAVFGQTEGLLGSELELRELQKSGRIGRIEVNTENRVGKTEGAILVPSSLDKTETAIVAAALETIQRIGPCNARVKVQRLEDIRVSKRAFVIQRAKELLKAFTETALPDSQEMTDEVSQSIRMMEVTEWGKDRLPAGPGIDEAEEIILVEGRADVLNLLKYGFKNAIALNGTSVPESLTALCGQKTVTLFVDGDRGGDLITREALETVEIDFVVKAPDGKEVEELTKKEIHKALRGKVTVEQARMDLREPVPRREPAYKARAMPVPNRAPFRGPPQGQPHPLIRAVLPEAQKVQVKQLLDDLVGTRGAYLLGENMTILGKVPVTEVQETLRSIKGVYAIVFDGSVTQEFTALAERNGIQHLVGMDTKIPLNTARLNVMTVQSFS